MKGDFTRSTFRPRKHYSSVRMQQGRVQLDADWNEQVDIAAHRVESDTCDVVGRYGVPFLNPGFLITGGAIPSIGKGHLYLDGILVENDKDVLITEQSEFLPNYKPTKTAGEYLAYLDVWQRHVTALEDDLIREVALGPDTATRTQAVWQVRLIGPLAAPLTCADNPADWKQLVDFVPGKMRARTAPGTTAANLCEVPAGAGYRRLENQLYRVEIQKPGPRGTATFKWSRDNGSIVTAWTGQNGRDLIVASIGRDQVLGFAADHTVELTDDDRELKGEAGILVKLSKVEGQVLTLDPSTPSVDRSKFGRNPKIRRWDSDGEILTSGTWTLLEEGVEVKFETGCEFKTGDYWMIPARTAKSNVEWPVDETDPALPAAVVRQGIVHHYCKLAILSCDGTNFKVTWDCRPKFPPLTMLTSLDYVSGDGQEAMPGNELPRPLEVRAACGGWVLEGATVRFTAEGNGRLAMVKGGTGASTVNTLNIDTGADGIARCYWKPEPNAAKPSQQVIALLIDADGNPVKDVHGNLVHVIHFNANLSIAGQVAYDPKESPDLAGAKTVQDAIDILSHKPGGITSSTGVVGISLTAGAGQSAELDHELGRGPVVIQLGVLLDKEKKIIFGSDPSNPNPKIWVEADFEGHFRVFAQLPAGTGTHPPSNIKLRWWAFKAAKDLQPGSSPVKTYTVWLKAIGSNKIEVIKKVHEITGLGLKEAKDLVESAPNARIKEGINKEEAEAIRKKLEDVGGGIVVVVEEIRPKNLHLKKQRKRSNLTME